MAKVTLLYGVLGMASFNLKEPVISRSQQLSELAELNQSLYNFMAEFFQLLASVNNLYTMLYSQRGNQH